MDQVTETLSDSFVTPAQPVPTSRLTVMDGLLILAMVIWATNYSIAKASLDVLPPFVFNTLRFGLGAIITLILIKVSGDKLILPRREWWPLIVISFLGNVVYQFFFLNGLHGTTVAHSVW